MAPSSNCEQNSNENNVDNQSVGVPDIEKMGGRMLINKLAGEGVVKVVKQCEKAKETLTLDLSQCNLAKFPDAVFYLLRDTTLTACDLSSNVLRRIPPQLAFKFSLITDLNLSKNEIYKLPDELEEMKELVRLDVSHNYLLNLPSVLFRIPKLRQLRANHNAIIDIESNQVIASESLEFVDLRSNPFTPQCYKLLKNAQVSFHIELSTRRIKEDWEDLTI
ncbi:leucine-rich repeat-containing protein 20-like [Bradysia coprophila]|uniref:leucine-rich repeat-containing protein 20-like n=1 Tax=Bradysia coprophila TaxID=38358 RepID=UPI00187DA5EA|nr:leucine-rich repeat-containing protein 20-like [Bradysia coprophila]